MTSPIQSLEAEFSAASVAVTPDRATLVIESTCTDDIPGCPKVQSTHEKKSNGLNVFYSTFITIFLAELGDKTQIATLLMSAESHSPALVFIGAGTALIATSLLGVLIGRWLSNHLSPRTLDIAAGITLLTISLLLILDVVAL